LLKREEEGEGLRQVLTPREPRSTWKKRQFAWTAVHERKKKKDDDKRTESCLLNRRVLVHPMIDPSSLKRLGKRQWGSVNNR
jgi:hypothetical protein